VGPAQLEAGYMTLAQIALAFGAMGWFFATLVIALIEVCAK